MFSFIHIATLHVDVMYAQGYIVTCLYIPYHVSMYVNFFTKASMFKHYKGN